MASSNSRHSYFMGIKDGLPFLLVVLPFALLFGVVATEAGLNLAETMGFSVLVIAGAAQFTAVSLMADHVPVLILLATSLAVNLRMAMYSASLAPHIGAAPLWQRALAAYVLVDQVYALSVATFEERQEWGIAQRMAYYFGTATPLCLLWYIFTYVGAVVGSAIPEWMALDFAVPICFLALIGPALRTIAHVAAATTSVVLALLLAFIPYGLGLIIAALAAMMVGAAVEKTMEGRNA